MSDELPPQEAPVAPAAAPDDEMPEVRRRLWDLEWRLRRESGAMAEKLATIFKELVQTAGWGSEAVAEGLTPVLSDLRRRLIALETRSHEGLASGDPAFKGLADRLDVLERMVEDGLTAQRAEMARVQERLDELSGRLDSVEAFAGRLEALETQAEASRRTAAELEAACARISELEQRTVPQLELGQEQLADQIQDHAAAVERGFEEQAQVRSDALVDQERRIHERLERDAAAIDARIAGLEEGQHRLEDMVESAAGDLGIRAGEVEARMDRAEQELEEKVPQAQFASSSLAMAAQQAAIKELKTHVAALSGDTKLSSGLSPTEPGPGPEQVQALWEALERLEGQLGEVSPQFDRIGREIDEAKKGTKGLMANWMELEGRLNFLAEKRQVDHLESRLNEVLAKLLERT